jgi:hypothetical protein
VNSEIPTIIFEAKDAATGQELAAVKLTMDGEVLGEQLDGTALPVDPGEHDFTFETVGQTTVVRRLLIHAAEKDRRELVAFGTPPATPSAGNAGPQATVATLPTPPTAPPQTEESNGGSGAQKTIAIVSGGIGLVGVVVGTVFGLQSKSKHDKAAALDCSGATCPNDNGVAETNDAIHAGNISTVAFIVGAVGLAGGAVLWFTAKPAESSQPQLGMGLGNLQLRGVW